MKPTHITLFIFILVENLMLLCLLWPAEGVSICGYEMRWPTLQNVMSVPPQEIVEESSTSQEADLSPEERLAHEMEATYQAKEDQFLEFASNSPIRIHMPDSNVCYLDTFFMMLDNAHQEQVRIMHYGDSQLEEDRISSQLRNHLQQMFGGYGTGMQPAQWITRKMTIKHECSPRLKYRLAYGPSTYRLPDGNRKYGPMLQVSRIYGHARIHFSPRSIKDYSLYKKAERISVLTDGHGTIKISTPDSTFLLVDEDTIAETKLLTVDLPKRSGDITVTTDGAWNLYCVSLEGRKGVVLDNIALRGYDGISFSRVDRKTMTPFFKSQNIGLIMLQFGGNAVPYLKDQEALDRWKKGIGKQIDYFKSLAPNARIMLIGPADMSTSKNGTKQTYPILPDVVKALREVSNEHGVCFWSMYDAMGGWNSMLKWVAARPQLAGEDYIHFTHKGADQIADLLDQVILAYYKYYRLHNRLDPIEDEIKTPTDTLRSDTVSIAK